MAGPARDWIGAASYCEGPRPVATFADLPRKQQHEMLRFVFAAALSTTYFIALALLARPLHSRSLVGHTALPDATIERAAMLDMRPVASFDPPRRSLRDHGVKRRATLQLASLSEPLVDDRPTVDDSPTVSDSPRPERRRNIFSRFFRVFHSSSPVVVKGSVP